MGRACHPFAPIRVHSLLASHSTPTPAPTHKHTGHSRGAINATLYSGQASIPEPSTQQQQQQACSGHPSTAPDPAFHPVLSESAVDGQFAEPCAETTPATATTTAGATSSSRSRGSSSWSHIIPLVVLVAGRFDLTVNMHQRYGADVVQQLRDSGPWEQRCKRDGDGHQIDWTLSAEVSHATHNMVPQADGGGDCIAYLTMLA